MCPDHPESAPPSPRRDGGPSLLADLGGTNARFALVEEDGAIRHEAVLRVASHPSLASAIGAYLDQVEPERPPREAALAIACPIRGDWVEMTNHAWAFSIRELKDALAFRRLEVINDFSAQALAIPHLTPDDVVQIGKGDRLMDYPIGVLGPGTGLGVGSLIPTKTGWRAIPGEGGHVTMAPIDDRQSAVLAHLRRRYAHVSAERVLSGMGLVNLYETLATLDGIDAPVREPAAITEAALAGSDRQCREAVDMFCAMLGTVAGNLALTLGTFGGVFIAGGIAPRLGQHFIDSSFRESFLAKGRFHGYLDQVYTGLVVNRTPAFLGLRGVLQE